MAGVLDKYVTGQPQNTEGQNAAATSGGVFGTVQHKGVLDKYVEQSRPSDPIYDQWKLEQQLKEQMRQRRVQETAAQEAAAKAVFAPQAPVEQKTKEELRTDRKAAMETAREERRQARAEAGEAYATAEDPVAALPLYKKALADANAAFDAAKTAAWEPANRQAAPERYDPFVQNAGQAKAEWYDPAVIAKGEQVKGNPLHEDARKKLAGGGMGNVNAAMEEMRAIDALTEDQKAYINYVYGKYDKKLAGQLTETLLQNVLNTLNAADERQKTQNVFTAVGGQVLAAPVYAAEMLGQAAENLAKGSNLPVAEYTPGSRMMSEATARTQDLVDDAKTPVGEFLTQTGVGVGQNVLNMVLFGKAAPAVMAIQSMGSGGYEAAQNGATGWQQLGKGAQSAVTELVTEKISFGKLEDILNGVTPKTAKGIIAKIAAQMATEAGEETAGEAISILYDWIAMGDKGDLAQVMKEYREENGGDGAGGYLALQILQRLGEAAAGGAISGGILGGGATVMNAVQSRNAAEAHEQAADLTQETAEAAGDDAARMETETAESAIKRGVEEMPAEEKEAVIAKELEALPQDLQSNAENENEIDGILKELGYKTETVPVQSEEQETDFQGRVDDSAIRNIELTERQKADRKVYEALSSALGVKIRLTASKADEMGRRSGANGYYDRRTNSFVFDINAENFSDLDRDAKGQLNTAAVLTMSHELTHYIERWNPEQYNVLKDTVMQILQERTGQDVATIINRKRQTLMQDGQPRMDDAAVLDEIVADGCQMMLRDSGLFEQIAQKNRTLGQKIIDWLRGAVNALRKAYEGLSARSSEAKYIGQVAENYQRVLDRWTEALMTARDISKGGTQQVDKNVAENPQNMMEGQTGKTEATKKEPRPAGYWATKNIDNEEDAQKESEYAENGVEIDRKTESAAPADMVFRRRTWTESEWVQERERMAAKLAKDTGVTVKKAQRYLKNIDSVARLIANDRARLDYDPNTDDKATAVKDNSEYKKTLDFSTLCAKRLLFTGTFDEIQRHLPNRALTSEEIVELRKMMMDRGYQVACGICYVESTRREIGPITQKFIEQYKKAQQTGEPIKTVNDKGEEKTLYPKDQKGKTDKTRPLYAEPGYTPTLADLNTTDIDAVKAQHPEVYEAYLAFMNARGQQKPKLLETRAEYKGEIAEFSRALVDSLVSHGGFRLQSFSDFEVPHLIDMMQAVLDMHKVGLTSQAYTKVPLFAEVFGRTGIKINLSLIAKGSGLDAQGRLIFDDVEGMPASEAFRLRAKYSKNVGTILVGKTDAHIEAAMKDPRIDYIIPFHKSSWNAELYDALGLTGYQDYTKEQNEKDAATGKTVKNYDPSEYWDPTKSGDENAQIYLEKCRKEGRIPKFEKFAGKPGYWKLLIDFKMYDNKGNFSPQEKVKPDFNMAAARRILNAYEGGHQTFPVAEDVVKDFVAKLTQKEFNETPKMQAAAPEYISLSRRQPWQVDLKTGAWEATTDVPGRQAPYQKPRQTEQISKMLEEQTKPSDKETITDLQSTASQVKQPEAESTANVQQTETKPEELPKAEKTESNGSENPNKSGWEKFKENRIAQAMQHKPEGAVARMDVADSVRKAEEEIAKAKELLNGLKDNAEPGEIDDAESIAKGHKTLQQVSADFSKEKVARMAEQMRLIKQWEEQGIVGQKKRLHSEQFKAAEKLLEGADDAIFEHDTKGAKKLISKRKGELFRMLSSTSERVMRQVFDKKTAQRAIEEYIRPAEQNEAAKIMAIGRLFDGARELKLNRYESTMVQLVGEGLVPAWSKAGTNPLWHNGQALVESLPEYARANPEIQKLAENLGEIDAQKITKAVTWYRKTYDDFHALVNDFRLAHGMPEIGNIEQYFPHFSQDMDGDMLNQTLKAFGIEQMSSLPASIAGMTQGFRPFSRWVGSFQKRTGPQTVFDAEQGFQMYANAVMDMLYHTDDIMRIRHLETMIRRRSKEAGETGKRPGTKEQLEAMKQTMENPEQLKKLEEDMELGERDGSGKDISGEYSGFVQWLREYGNKLAGKGDTYRLAEPVAGRQAANVINKLLGNYGTAQIVGNLRSAIANTAVLPKMLALLGTQKGSALKPEIYIGQALGKMARGEMASLYGKSEFMTSKQGVEPLVKTKKDKAADVMMKFFNVVEDAMSKLAFTAGYVQAEDQLKDSNLNAKELEREAIQRANDFAANIMARRDKAGSALLGRSREPILRLVGMFQTEISNEWQTLRQDLPREYEELEQQIGKKKAQATYAAALARYVVYSHVLGFAAEAIFGINPFNDVWAWIADFVRNIWEEPEEKDEKGKLNFGAVTDLAGEVAGSVPYLSTIAALAGYTNDRLPLFNAKEFVEDLGSIVTAERFSGRVEGLANVAGSVGQLMGIPGTGQGVKTVKGAAALLDQGKRSQKTGQLQDVWQWDGGKGAGDAARALAFGPSAMKGMREYYDSGYRAELTTAQTEAYDAAIGAGVPKDKALEYVKWSKGVTAERDEKDNTVPHSRNVKFLMQVESIEGLTPEQKAILYQGALPSDQAEEFEKMSQTVKNMGIDTETWLEFLRRYYQINGSGKKDKVKKLMAVLSIPPVWQKDLAKVVGYEL